MSRPILPSGMASAGDDLRRGVGLELVGDDDVRRQHDLDAGLLGLRQVALDGLDLVLLEERVAHRVALGREEREEHAAADEQAVGLGQQVGDDAELVRHLRAAEDDDVRPRRVVGRLAQRRDLLEDELADRVREHQRDVVDRRLLAVHDAEAVGHEHVGQLGQLAGQLGALGVDLGRLARVEPDVLQQGDLAVLQRGDRGLGGVADDVRRQRDRLAEQLGRGASATGLSEYLSSGAPFGRPRWAVTTTRAPAASSAWSVGRAARTRPSSVMVVPSSGTLKSERTSTRLPRRSPRSSMVFMRLLPVTRAGADTAASACARATGAGAHADA